MSDPAPFSEVPTIAAPIGPALPVAERLPRFIGCRGNAAKRLAKLRVAIVGSGSVGGRAAEDLARLGVAEIWIVDPKAFKSESLLTHSVGPSEIGEPKAGAVARRCKILSPGTRVFYFNGPVQALPLDAFADVDLVVLASDNLACEVEVGQRCLHLNRPIVHAAVHGESLSAVVAVFANATAQGPCPRCLYGEAEEAALAAQAQYSCQPASNNHAASTMSVSALCAMAAAMAGQQILRLVLGLGEPVEDTFLEYNAYTHRTVVTTLARRPNCPCDHSEWTPARAPRPLPECAVNGLVQIALGPAQREEVAVAVAGYDWVESALCPCGVTVGIARFVAGDRHEAGRCPSCGTRLPIQSFYRRPFVTVQKLGQAAAQSLRRLGASTPRAVLVRTETKRALFRFTQITLP